MLDSKVLLGLQEICYQIMSKFHEFCVERNLTYYLCGGTLLGAVRHGGFIPWDDDIDIAMPREDYDLLLNKYADALKEPLELTHYSKNNFSYGTVIRIYDTRATLVYGGFENGFFKCGINIDILPLDGGGKTLKQAERKARQIRDLSRFYGCSSKNKGKGTRKYKLWEKTVIKACQIIGPDRIMRKLEKEIRQYSYETSDYVGTFLGVYCEKEVVLKQYLGKPTLIKFNDEYFYGPENVDAYLTRVYGDYMTPPPVEERGKHHDCVYVDFDKSYKEFNLEEFVEDYKLSQKNKV